MQIRAAVLRSAHSRFEPSWVDLAPPKEGEVRVKVMAAGVCHSDWHLATGATPHPFPLVAGHEGAGIVDEVGFGVEGIEVGDHVCLNWAPSCGTCFYCERGQQNLCSAFVGPIWAGTMLDGTTRLSENGHPLYHFSSLACFAEYAVVPSVCCVKLSKEVPFPVAAVIGCAVSTGVGSALKTVHVEPGSSVAVIGTGGVGLSIIMGARLAGASRIIGIDKSRDRLSQALSFGATDAVESTDNWLEAVRDLTDGRGADYVFEAVGTPGLQEQCLDAVRPGGVLLLVGISPVGSGTNLPGAILTRQEKTVKGSYYGSVNPAEDFPKFAQLYLDGELDLDRLVTKNYSLEQINEAYEDMIDGRVARGVLVMHQP